MSATRLSLISFGVINQINDESIATDKKKIASLDIFSHGDRVILLKKYRNKGNVTANPTQLDLALFADAQWR